MQKSAKDYAIVSQHEKGFWQVDVYWGMEKPPEEVDVPDHFKTGRIGEPVDVATCWVRNWYPNAEILMADEDEYDDDDYDDAQN